jgi:drug/metabolite transporter (DMT)-like permease
MTIAQTLPSPSMSAREWMLLLLLGAIWGGSFFFARIAVTEIPPLVLVLLRVGIASVALHIYLLVAGPSFGAVFIKIGPFLVLALLNNVIPFSLIFAGQTQMGAGLASVLNATTPMWTLIVTSLLSHNDKLTWNKLAGVLLGIAGTGVMIGPGLVAGLGGSVWAKFALVGAALSYAFALVFARRYFAGIPSRLVAAGQLTASTIIMIPVVAALYGSSAWVSASPHVWAAVLGLALLSTAFAYVLYFRILASSGPTNASLVTLIVPASAILLGVIFLNERLEAFEVVGMALIGLGLITIDGRLFSRK